MTQDELFRWTCEERNALKVEARALRLENAALSAKLGKARAVAHELHHELSMRDLIASGGIEGGKKP